MAPCKKVRMCASVHIRLAESFKILKQCIVMFNNTISYHHLVKRSGRVSASGRLDPTVDWFCTTSFDETPQNCPNLNPADIRREAKKFDKRRSKGQLRDQVHSLYWWKVSRALDLGKLKAPSKQQYRAAALKFASFDPTADNMWQKVKMEDPVVQVMANLN